MMRNLNQSRRSLRVCSDISRIWGPASPSRQTAPLAATLVEFSKLLARETIVAATVSKLGVAMGGRWMVGGSGPYLAPVRGYRFGRFNDRQQGMRIAL